LVSLPLVTDATLSLLINGEEAPVELEVIAGALLTEAFCFFFEMPDDLARDLRAVEVDLRANESREHSELFELRGESAEPQLPVTDNGVKGNEFGASREALDAGVSTVATFCPLLSNGKSDERDSVGEEFTWLDRSLAVVEYGADALN
jgi:hypothetical protein